MDNFTHGLAVGGSFLMDTKVVVEFVCFVTFFSQILYERITFIYERSSFDGIDEDTQDLIRSLKFLINCCCT